MKRLFALVLALCLALPTFAFAAEEERSFYVDLSLGADSLYYANVCWAGVTYADDVSAIRFTFSYPAEKLVCKSWKIGQAMRAFQIKQGPQYTESNPATFVAMSIDRPVTSEGVLASFVLEPIGGATGEAELSLEIREVVRLTDTAEITDAFSARGAKITLGAGEEKPAALPCDEDASIHADLPFSTDPDQAGVLVRLCPYCHRVLETREVDSPTSDPSPDGEVTFSPGTNQLPPDVSFSADASDETIPEDVLSDVKDVSGEEDLSFIGAMDVSLTWEGDRLTLGEAGSLSIPAPEGIGDGDVVWVAIASESGERETYRLTCEGGKLTFPVRVFGKVYLLKGEGGEADTPSPAPEGEGEPETEESEQPGLELSPALWGLVAVPVFGALAALIIILVKKNKKNKDQL